MSYRALAVLLILAAPAACKKANSAAGGPGGGAFAFPVEVALAIRDTVGSAAGIQIIKVGLAPFCA